MNLLFLFPRANSISNVACNTSISPVTRRSSERELGDGSAKKRATSASGLDRQSDGKIILISFKHFFLFNFMVDGKIKIAGIFQIIVEIALLVKLCEALKITHKPHFEVYRNEFNIFIN